ncbi:MAG: hypothetical protein M1833_000600 [Piccolia ochrophora]|nr:MAG: hypothetical protein M1833_000600 [Piccolia ochrophora]
MAAAPSTSNVSRSPSPSPSASAHAGASPRPRADTIHLTPYSSRPPLSSASSTSSQASTQEPWISHDPRSSSTQSLLPTQSGSRGNKRTLLLIFLHGFLGDETSFRSFPAHLHNLLTLMLVDSHVVHTKIYPRYKSKKKLEHARDDLSHWLAPNEGPETDTILLGHSMGGLLSAEVTLLPPHPYGAGRAFRHRILGTVNFDTPFLGMHPGVVVSGISSLFRPSVLPEDNPEWVDTGLQNEVAAPASLPYATKPTATEHTVPSTSSLSLSDPNFDPPFPNDVRHQVRTGWDSALHFVLKHHSEGLTRATTKYVTSHLEFGGCLADYVGLRNRYAKIRALEDAHDVRSRPSQGYQSPLPRVRFVNYYTASTGRPKSPTPSARESSRTSRGSLDLEPPPRLSQETTRSRSRSPRISLEEHRDGQVILHDIPDAEVGQGIADNGYSTLDQHAAVDTSQSEPLSFDPPISVPYPTSDPENKDKLPVIPPPPQVPDPPKPLASASKADQKATEKAYARAMKDYKAAVRNRDKIIHQRQKELSRRAKADAATQRKAGNTETGSTQSKGQQKHPRERKFCTLPSPLSDGSSDTTWVRVFMEGVDEVGAHCGLFFIGELYEKLVGDVGARIEEWVKEEESAREVQRLVAEGQEAEAHYIS